MKTTISIRSVCLTIAALLTGGASYADAGAGHVYWSLVTSYPQDTVLGRSLGSFADRLSTETQDYIAPPIQYRLARSTAQLIDDVQSGRKDIADVFGGGLARCDPLFELSTLPFLAQSVAEAKTLKCIAEPAYRDALARAGLHLLVVSPWPPTGLWSRTPLRKTSDIARLKIRTYDEASAAVLESVGAQTASLPMEQVKPWVRAGDVDAVLSSGDGPVGDSLAGVLPDYAAVQYAFPVSFPVMSESRFKALPAQRQQELMVAARDVQAEEWRALPQRTATNYAHMRDHGVSIEDPISPDLRDTLQKEGQARARKWLGRVGAAGRSILDTYNNRSAIVTNLECQSGSVGAQHGDPG